MKTERALSAMTPETQTNVKARILKVQGQVSGIRRMIDQERSSDDILEQIAAVRGALKRVSDLAITDRVEQSLGWNLEANGADRMKLGKLLGSLSKYMS